jgi:hypothetical protein
MVNFIVDPKCLVVGGRIKGMRSVNSNLIYRTLKHETLLAVPTGPRRRFNLLFLLLLFCLIQKSLQLGDPLAPLL